MRDFWNMLEELIQENDIAIDRRKNSVHPRFPNFVYLLDYGFINGTSSQDGNEIDVFCGDDPKVGVTGIICTVDSLKKDSEVKILYSCSEENIQTALKMTNHNPMRGILIRRDEMQF